MIPRVAASCLVVAGLAALAACGGTPEKGGGDRPPAATSPSGPAPGQPGEAPPPEGGKKPELPPGHPPLGGAPMSGQIVPPTPGSGEGASAVRWETPQGWISETPSSLMRKAQYKVSGKGGDAECVVFYFGPGQGGDPMSNAQRWAAQFRKPDGTPATDLLKTSERVVGGLKVLLVEVKGTYEAGSTMGAPAEEKPGYALLGAVAEGPDASWFFKFTGPQETIDAERASFDRMIASLRSGS